MIVDIAWWDLDGIGQTVNSLRDHLQDGGAVPWAGVAGLWLKFWVADTGGNRWGAVMIWEAERPASHLLPPNQAADLIGRPPDQRLRFTVQAVVEGRHTLPISGGVGPAPA